MREAVFSFRNTACHRIAWSLVTLIVVGVVSAAATEPTYCVRPINVRPADETADLARKLNSREPLPNAPDIFDQSIGASYPLVFHGYSVNRLDGLATNHSLYWSFSPNYELLGPRDYRRPERPIAVGRLGQSLAVGSSDETLDDGELRSHSRLLQQLGDGVLDDVEPALQNAVAEPQFVAWSDILDGFVVRSIVWREGPEDANKTYDVFELGTHRAGKQRVFLIRGNTPISLSGIWQNPEIVMDLPSLGVAVLLGSGSLSLANADLESTKVARISQGTGGFVGLYETRDPGWIYIAARQYDHAVRLEHANGSWRATDIVRIAKNDGRLGALRRRLFGEPRMDLTRDGISKIVHAGFCRRFSTTIKRMIFCEEMSEFRAGQLVPIGGGKIGLRTFLGDASSLGMALFVGTDGRLYGYDGDLLHLISNATFDLALVRDLPIVGRTFLTTKSDLFELRPRGGDVELVKLITTPLPALLSTDLYTAPDGAAVLSLMHGGIYQLIGDTLTLIWSSADYGSIDTTGNTRPIDVIGWKGILFTTQGRVGRSQPQFQLVTSCSVPVQ